MTNFLKATTESWLHKLKNAQVRMSNDNDGVVASSLLRHEKGWETTQFYNYEQLAQREAFINTAPIVAVDCGVTSDASIYSIDNHVGINAEDSFISPSAINLNLFNRITPSNYTEKFAMSTTFLTWVALGKPLPLKEVGKMILIALDGGHAGYYGDFRNQYLKNLEQLGVMEELLPILEKHTKEDFELFLREKLGAGSDKVHLLIDNDELWVLEKMYEVYEFISNELGFPVELPKGNFKVIQEFNKLVRNFDTLSDLSRRDDIKSWAFISSKKVSYSLEIPKRKQKAGA